MLTDAWVGIIAWNDTAELCLTAEEEVTFYSDKKRWAGLRAVSFLFIHCDGYTTSSGIQLHWMPLTVIQRSTWKANIH